jgi:hypothetical protein
MRHWTRPERVVAASQLTGTSSIAFDGRGNEFLAWAGSGYTEKDGSTFLQNAVAPVQVAIRRAGRQRFGAPQTLSSTPGADINIKVADNGAAIALWGINGGFQYAVRPSGGEFGPPQTIWNGRLPADLGMARDGSALISWGSFRSVPYPQPVPSGAIYRVSEGPFEPVPYVANATSVASAVNVAGDMALLWVPAPDPSGMYGPTQMVTRSAGGNFGVPHPTGLSYGVGGPFFLTAFDKAVWMFRTSSARRPARNLVCSLNGQCSIEPFPSFTYPELATDGEGRVVGISSRFRDPTPHGIPRDGVETIYSTVRGRGGRLTGPQAVARGRRIVPFFHSLTVGARGDRVVAWNERYGFLIYASVFRPGRGWMAAGRVTPFYKFRGYGRTTQAEFYGVGVGPRGQISIAWAPQPNGNEPHGLLISDYRP